MDKLLEGKNAIIYGAAGGIAALHCGVTTRRWLPASFAWEDAPRGRVLRSPPHAFPGVSRTHENRYGWMIGRCGFSIVATLVAGWPSN